MTEEEFFAHIDEAEQQIAQGEKYEFNNSEAMNAWLNAL
jgi:anthranilate/para-aminobenzoate synthase component I